MKRSSGGMKNEYRIFEFSRRFSFRYVPSIQKEKERASQKEHILSPLVSYSVDMGHSFNR
jgi:hypothetical protein